MNQVLQYPAEFLKETGHAPSVCLVLPFEPQLYDKSTITCRLKTMLAKAEGRLLQFYSTHKAIPVLTKVQQLIAGINYSNYRKSIAILATPFASRLFYLDFPVTETIQTGEYLNIREVVKAKSRETQYLVMVLGNHWARMYTGTSTTLTCIKQNREAGDPASGYGNHFLHKMDQGLGFMLSAYQLPVFILGQEQVLEPFKHITTHTENIIGYLPGSFDTSNETAILMTLQSELHHWNKHKHRYLIQKLYKAHKDGKLSCGIKEVWNTATHRRGQLLVVEENFTSPCRMEREGASAFTRSADDPYNMKDLVDDIIEKVLKDGGDVEFVDQGTLSSFQQIALIEFRQSE
ncbi:hypothetical protein HB364_22125 [Pseudoflavitalea sp. X16]|uniref:baeRF3 domain-containing protein n=1 Tax=Paraflavitalea devenefica TaxID=2716334 RepID=UPI00141F62FC|nr:hypothetical protein [Paraflavitalea devenefica]NII27796.1 hypothetical protein [Paraflavitalea devenefica]